jgi:putative holliday junction resolvase
VRLGMDVGAVRIGIAVSDPHGLVATPVETVPRDPAGGGEPAAACDLERIAVIAAERDAVEVVVGLPTSMSGREGPAAAAVRTYANALAARLAPLPVRLVDERLTTVSATRALRHAGIGQRKGRPVVDQVAALIILQSALDIERGTGAPPGTLVSP